MGNAVGTPPSGPNALFRGRRGSSKATETTPTPASPQRRNFTREQLAAFDGSGGDAHPVYLSLRSDVYDVSARRERYGPSGLYAALAGKDVTRALLTNRLQDEQELMRLELDDLDAAQLAALEVRAAELLQDEQAVNVGRLVESDVELSRDELRRFDGVNNARQTVYVVLLGVVFDVTLNGLEHYGPDGVYAQFAGQDASRALACMSFDPSLLDDPSLDLLSPEQRKTLDDWFTRFQGKYAAVGRLRTTDNQ